jgi:F-type H+-transporting ATPase subunit a
MKDEYPVTWFGQFLGIPYKLDHIISVVMVVILMIIGSWLAVRALRKAAADPLPDGKVSFRGIVELIVEALDNFVKSVMGHHGRTFVPLIGTLFIFLFICNTIGVIPGFLPPTANVNTNIAAALVIFFLTHYYGVKEHGGAYIKHFMGPVILLAPLLFVIEMISHAVRPLSLTIRLYGNIDGDHIVLDIFSNLWEILGINLPDIFLPVIFLGLGLFVSFMQAFVFALLSMVYIAGAVAHDH